MIRPKGIATTEPQREVLTRLRLLASQRAQLLDQIVATAKEARGLRLSVDVVADAAGISRATLYRRLNNADKASAKE